MSRTPDDFNSAQQDWRALVGPYCEGMLPADDLARLDALLVSDPEIRREFIRLMQVHTLLARHFSPPQPAQWPESEIEKSEVGTSKSEVGGRKSEEKPARPTRPLKSPPAPIPDSPILNPQSSILNVLRHPATFWSLLGFVVVGMMAIVFWSTRSPGPVATTPAGSAATLVQTTDAKWQDDSAPAGDALAPGQRLKLTSGSVTITFKSQARVIVDGPAELTIVDATACRLSNGKLTAQVPAPAKGFKVHTPDGTVTDLGTEFGVFVSGPLSVVSGKKNSEPITDSRQPTASSTEVHVFKGKVDLTDEVDNLAQAPPEPNSPPQSPIPPRKSQILSAGQAVTISDNKVQPLPAADPFKFALDKLAGQPRKVLLSDDFETYDIGPHNTAIGPWIVQTRTRKGQGVSVSDLTKAMADSNAIKPNPSFRPPPAIGVRSVDIAASAQNPKETFPLLAREIDGRQLGGTCQVLIEFDLMPSGQSVQPSLALATEVGHTAGIELWHDADPALPPVEWTWNQPYRVRVLMDVVNGTVRAARVQRSQWRGQDGWVSDRTFHPPIPKLDWTTPPRYAIFGFAVVTAATPATHFWLDNIRIEVISEK
ncbi:MAG: FecR family protein [Planctomycetia bacterium]|nr:FecR family protein [Planctomycetia bacterium]